MMKIVRITVSGLAALWVLYTGYQLTLAALVLKAGPGVRMRLMSVSNAGVDTEAWLLTYEGAAGVALLVAQFAWVGVGLVLSLARGAVARRIGLSLLLAWSALWLGNAIWLTLAGWNPPGMLALIIAGFVLTAGAVLLRWGRNTSR